MRLWTRSLRLTSVERGLLELYPTHCSTQRTVRGLYHQSPDVTVKTEALAHGEAPFSTHCSPFTVSVNDTSTFSSQLQNISPSGQWGQELLHMLRCFFHSLAFWVTEQLTNCPQETIGHMVRGKVPYRAIKPFVLRHRGASVWDEGYVPRDMAISLRSVSQINADTTWKGFQHKLLLHQPWGNAELELSCSDTRKKKTKVKFKKISPISTSYRNSQDSPKGLQDKYKASGVD